MSGVCSKKKKVQVIGNHNKRNEVVKDHKDDKNITLNNFLIKISVDSGRVQAEKEECICANYHTFVRT